MLTRIDELIRAASFSGFFAQIPKFNCGFKNVSLKDNGSICFFRISALTYYGTNKDNEVNIITVK